MTSPAPGWYPDPGGTAPYRWWNGQAWTTATSDGAPAAPTQVAAPGVPGVATPGYGAGQFGAVDPGAAAADPGQMTAYGTPSPFASTTSSYAQVTSHQQARADTFFHKNQFAMWTFIVVAIYIFIAVSTGFGIIGIVPALMSYRSFSRGEQLAPFAIGAAVIAIVVGVATFNH